MYDQTYYAACGKVKYELRVASYDTEAKVFHECSERKISQCILALTQPLYLLGWRKRSTFAFPYTEWRPKMSLKIL